MANKAIIKKDELGLYVIAGGSIVRPFFGTIFKEGDKVKAHCYGGCCQAGVTFDNNDFSFKKCEQRETWWSTGISDLNYKNKIFKPDTFEAHGQIYKSFDGQSYNTFEGFMKVMTEWYRNQVGGEDFIFIKGNKKFAETYQKL